jgi:hypothetical protein
MRIFFVAVAAATGIILGLAWQPTVADDGPVLAVLQRDNGFLGLFPSRAKIRVQPGVITSPFAGSARALWGLLPGDTLKQSSPPPERLLQFYQISGNSPQLLCTIIIKYEQVPGGWRPAFFIGSQPLMTWDGEKLIPIATEESARGQIQILQPAAPNANGFYAGFVFGFATGPSQIDAWAVQ